MPRSVEDLRTHYRNRPQRLRNALRARAAWEREVARQLAKTDYPALKAESDRLAAMRDALFERIMSTRATTPAGMLAKLDTLGEEPLPDDACASVYDDLCILAGRAVS
jgi:hypothetical protein